MTGWKCGNSWSEDEKIHSRDSKLWESGSRNSYPCEGIFSSSIFRYREERLIFNAFAVNSLLN